MAVRSRHHLPDVLPLLCLLTGMLCVHGCIFSENFGVGSSGEEPDATTIIIDMSDMGEGEDLPCSLGSGTCQLGCAGKQDCPGGNSDCIGSICVDFLTDPMNCGSEGIVCDTRVGSSCVDGWCTCGDQDVTSHGRFIDIFKPTDTFRPWPAAQLVAYPTADFYECIDEVTPLDMCVEARFDQDYPLDAPHFVAMGARDGVNGGGDMLTLRVLDGRGSQLGADLTYAGKKELGENKLLMFQSLFISEDELKLFVLWEAGLSESRMRRLKSYSVKKAANNSLDIQADIYESEQPFAWVEDKDIWDFSLALGAYESSGGDARGVLAIPVVFANDVLSEGRLEVRGAVFSGDTVLPIVSNAQPLGDVKQVLSGFGATFVTPTSGLPRLDVVVLAEKYEGAGTSSPSAPDVTQAFYNRYAFTVNGEQAGVGVRMDIDSPRSTTVGETVVNSWSLAGLLFADRSSLPTPFQVLWDQGRNTLLTMGWSRSRKPRTQQNQDPEDSSNYIYTELPQRAALEQFSFGEVSNRGIYDSDIVIKSDEELYVYSIEAGLDGSALEDDAQVRVSKLLSSGGVVTLGTSKELTPDIRARRLSAVVNPHATGLLVTSLGQNSSSAKATLFFVAGGDEPVCKPSGTAVP